MFNKPLITDRPQLRNSIYLGVTTTTPMKRHHPLKLSLSLLLMASASSSYAQINFNVQFTAAAMDANTGYTESERQLFINGMNYWDSVIDGHQDNVSRSFTLTVDSLSQAANNGSVLLGSAGPTNLFFSEQIAGASPSFERYILAGNGSARFNTHPDAGELRYSTILHEIGHTLGIGGLWEDNELQNDGIADNQNRTDADGIPGQYTGKFALAAYRAEFDAAAAFIPVEQGGGPGTAYGHWNEVDGGGGLTGITDAQGRDFRDELMTGWASRNEADSFVSNTTIQSLRDIGFTLEAVPEPSSTALLGIGSLVLISRRKRRT